MLNFSTSEKFTLLALFGKTIYTRGDINEMDVLGGFSVIINSPGENTWIPNIGVTFKGKLYTCGKIKGWTKIPTSETLEPDLTDEFTTYEDEDVIFEFRRAVAVKTYPLGNVETEDVFIIRNAVYKPYDEPFTLTSAPMYNLKGIYSHPCVFVKGIGAMVSMFKQSQMPALESK